MASARFTASDKAIFGRAIQPQRSADE